MTDVPCIVFALALHNGPADSVIPAVQNLMLAARAIGIGSVPTTLHPSVMDRFHQMFDIPDDVGFHFCVPLGYPQGNFGPNDAQADVGDDLPRPVGRSRSVGVRGIRGRINLCVRWPGVLTTSRLIGCARQRPTSAS